MTKELIKMKYVVVYHYWEYFDTYKIRRHEIITTEFDDINAAKVTLNFMNRVKTNHSDRFSIRKVK